MSDINVILADCPGLGKVRLCECSSIHLSLGPVTVNLEPKAFAQAAILIRTAMDRLIEIAAAQPEECNLLKSAERPQSQLTH